VETALRSSLEWLHSSPKGRTGPGLPSESSTENHFSTSQGLKGKKGEGHPARTREEGG